MIQETAISESPFSDEDTRKLEGMYSKSKAELRSAGIIILILCFILPFLPPKYRGSRAMIDQMSYPEAVAGIFAVFAVIFTWSYYFMIHTIKKDLKKKIKITVSSFVLAKNSGKYKGRIYCYFSAAGVPYRLGKLHVKENEFSMLNKGERVIVEYSKYGKRFIGWKKVQESKS